MSQPNPYQDIYDRADQFRKASTMPPDFTEQVLRLYVHSSIKNREMTEQTLAAVLRGEEAYDTTSVPKEGVRPLVVILIAAVSFGMGVLLGILL